MGLQLKGDNETTNGNSQFSMGTEEQSNPWDVPNVLEENEPYRGKIINNTMTATIQGQEKQRNSGIDIFVKFVVVLIVCAVLVFGGKAVVSVIMPEGEDITNLLRSDANTIATQLGVTFTDNSEWVTQIHQYSNGNATVKAAEDIGIVYIDGKQMGIHVRSKKYTMFDIQLGDSETSVYNGTSYPYDNFLSVLNDMAEGKTTTYFYYNLEQNDCLAIAINDTTNRVVGLTYFYDYNKVTETLE